MMSCLLFELHKNTHIPFSEMCFAIIIESFSYVLGFTTYYYVTILYLHHYSKRSRLHIWHAYSTYETLSHVKKINDIVTVTMTFRHMLKIPNVEFVAAWAFGFHKHISGDINCLDPTVFKIRKY